MFNSSNDRTGLCTFMFDDGRHCNMPHTQSELRLCYFHEKRERQRLLTLDASVKISRYLATNLHTACDLNSAFAMLFRAGSQGYLEPKMVNALTRLGRLMLETHLHAKQEYLDSYENEWRDIVLQSISLRPDPEPVPEPAANLSSQPHTIPPTSQEPPIDQLNLMEPTMDVPSPVAAGLPRQPSGEQSQPAANAAFEQKRRITGRSTASGRRRTINRNNHR